MRRWILVLVLIYQVSAKIESSWNAGCEANHTRLICEHRWNGTTRGSFNNLIYFRIPSCANVTTHILFSTLGGLDVWLGRTGADAELRVDWDAAVGHAPFESVSFSSPLHNQQLFSFPAIYLSSSESSAGGEERMKERRIGTSELGWEKARLSGPLAQLTSAPSELLGPNGTLKMSVIAHEKEGIGKENPSLMHTPGSVETAFIFQDIRPDLANLKLGLEMSAITSGKDEKVVLKEERSLDDEYTPGVFQSFTLDVARGGYASWKPVEYTSPARLVADIVKTHHGPLTSETGLEDVDIILPRLLAGSGGLNWTRHSLNLTLGQAKKKAHSGYATWNVVFGQGSVGASRWSSALWAAVVVGGAFPVASLALGLLLFTLLRRRGNSDLNERLME